LKHRRRLPAHPPPQPKNVVTSTKNSLFMRAARRVAIERTPVWFMRQAGRVLPEYRAIRERMTLLEICRHPELCAEVTLQPIRRFGMDAAILFADLMHPLVGIGIDLELAEHVGPVIAEPVRSEADLARIRPLDTAQDLPYVLESIRLIRRELAGRIPLIGFVGAPFTLASYLVEGRPSRDFLKTKQLMYSRPDVWDALMSRLADVIVSFAKAQIEAGVDVIQVFDSWIGCVSPQDYERFVRPAVRHIFQQLAPLGVPMIHFGVNTAMLLPQMKNDGGTIIGADWRIPLDDAWKTIGYDKGIQGNLDPAVLLAPAAVIDAAVKDVLARAANKPGHIFNLGHGLHPQTAVEGVQRAVEAVREFSARPANRAELAGAR
jgi:uroporphyrinogen decarboxylase